jgi:hypothetical protein
MAVRVVYRWHELQAFVEQGEYPSDEDLATTIRAEPDPIPPAFREYVAARLLRTVVRKRGRQVISRHDREARDLKTYRLAWEVRRRHAEKKMAGKPAPLQAAIRSLAADVNMSTGALEKRIKPAMRLVPSVMDMLSWLKSTGAIK